MLRKKRKRGKRRFRAGGLAAPLSALLLFAAGAGIFLYPAVSDHLARRQQTFVIQEYQEQVDKVSREEMKAEWEKAEEYNDNLAGDPVKDPFIPGSGYALPQNYREVLNVDGVMGYIEIPKISVRLPIRHGTSEEVLEKGVGHIESTALPIGGASRHAVLTGHRGLPSAELFTRLDELDSGDIFLIHVLDETLAYEVDQIKTVLPTELEDIQVVPGRDLVTLITCTPYGVNTHRLLVRGSRTEYIPDQMTAEEEQGESGFFKTSYAGMALGFGVLAATAAYLGIRRRRGGRRKENGKKC